jgi:hypothetical protein
MTDLPSGAVAASAWLAKQGISRQLVRKYLASGWLKAFGRGAFVRPHDSVDWLGGVYALQQLGLPVHVAADTALVLKGYGHFLPLGGQQRAYLFGERRNNLPAWFRGHAWQVKIRVSFPKLFDLAEPTGFTDFRYGAFTVRISAPERAILELLHLATTNDTINYAIELMAGLGSLRPQVVQVLLQGCRSVKVKRALLWMAEQAQHEWVSHLDLSRLELGKGTRLFYRGGTVNKKYHITVPQPQELPDA